MATITRIEDIDAWQSARELSEAFQVVSAGFARVDLKDQMQRAADSGMANIAEGFEAGYDPEFIRFLKIAKRSETEFQSHLHVARAAKQITTVEFDALYEIARRTKAQIGGFIHYLESCVKAKSKRERLQHKRKSRASRRRPRTARPETADRPLTEDRRP